MIKLTTMYIIYFSSVGIRGLIAVKTIFVNELNIHEIFAKVFQNEDDVCSLGWAKKTIIFSLNSDTEKLIFSHL